MLYKVKPGEEIVMTEEMLTQMHKIQLEILLEVDRICKLHHITYCLVGGSALGAVRHHGFIPWDDDVDIGMLRGEYDRFCTVCEKDLDTSRFFWQTVETDPGYRWTYGKMRRKGTRYVRSGQEHLANQTGVFCDIMPYDDCTDDFWRRYIQRIGCKCLCRMLWAPVGAVSEANSLKKGFYKLISKIPTNLLYHWFLCVSARYNGKGLKNCAQNSCIVNAEDIFLKWPKHWIENAKETFFEGYLFPIMSDVDTYLSIAYGDYMTYPSEYERYGNAPASLIEWPDI